MEWILADIRHGGEGGEASSFSFGGEPVLIMIVRVIVCWTSFYTFLDTQEWIFDIFSFLLSSFPTKQNK